MEGLIDKLKQLINQWENEILLEVMDPLLVLTSISEIFEAELKSYYINNDINPFDYHQVLQFSSNSDLAELYSVVFKNIILVHSLIVKYLNESYLDRTKEVNWNLNVATCRLLLNLIPCVEIYKFLQTFEKEPLIINRMFNWAENTNEPLQTYATGLLSFLGFSSISFKQSHKRLVPIVLDRLCSLYTQFCEETNQIDNSSTSIRPIEIIKIRRLSSPLNVDNNFEDIPENNENHLIQMYPLTISTQLYYCLKYLVPTAEDSKDLLLIPNESIPFYGIPMCLYYLSTYEKVMEPISMQPNQVLSDIIQYVILLLKNSHNSCRCYTVQFLNCSFNYRIMHELFDEHEGLYKLIDVINKPLILLIPEHTFDTTLPKTTVDDLKQTINHTCASLQIYFMGHLIRKTQQIIKMIESVEATSFVGGYNALNKITLDKFFEEIDILSTDETIRRYWMPTDSFIQFNGLSILLKLVNKAYWWLNDDNNCMNEVIKNALMVINIRVISRKGQLQLCEPLCGIDDELQEDEDEFYDEADSDGLTVLTNIADGNKPLDTELQIIALFTIVICVCAPIHLNSIIQESNLVGCMLHSIKAFDTTIFNQYTDGV